MKKFIILCQLFVLVIFVVKIAALGDLLQKGDLSGYFPLTVNRAMAEPPAKTAVSPTPKCSWGTTRATRSGGHA